MNEFLEEMTKLEIKLFDLVEKHHSTAKGYSTVRQHYLDNKENECKRLTLSIQIDDSDIQFY